MVLTHPLLPLMGGSIVQNVGRSSEALSVLTARAWRFRDAPFQVGLA